MTPATQSEKPSGRSFRGFHGSYSASPHPPRSCVLMAAWRTPALFLRAVRHAPGRLLEPAILACTVLEPCTLVLLAAQPTPPRCLRAVWHAPCRPLEPAVLAHILPYHPPLVSLSARPTPAHLPLALQHPTVCPLDPAVLAHIPHAPCTLVLPAAWPAPAPFRAVPWHSTRRLFAPAVLATPWRVRVHPTATLWQLEPAHRGLHSGHRPSTGDRADTEPRTRQEGASSKRR
jgi:hypothetical protein